METGGDPFHQTPNNPLERLMWITESIKTLVA